MKQLGYYFFKYWVSLGLFCYYGNLQVFGLENVPKNKPVIFLSNHQNALLDILQIAVSCNRKPWYLTRSDVFKNKLLSKFFNFLQMIPVYRIRDGRKNLSKNEATFKKSSSILSKNGSILLFPEANHSLNRYVRPLSKGFTRIIERTLADNPDMVLYLVPVGQNYQNATQIGDSAALFYGKPILVQSGQYFEKANKLKENVFKAMRELTTHVDDNGNYHEVIDQLNAEKVSFLYPEQINKALIEKNLNSLPIFKRENRFFRALFYGLNLPTVLLWRITLKPKVPELEFMATFRFGFAMLMYPLFYLMMFVLVYYFFDIKTACLAIAGHAVLNIFLVKAGITLSVQRK